MTKTPGKPKKIEQVIRRQHRRRQALIYGAGMMPVVLGSAALAGGYPVIPAVAASLALMPVVRRVRKKLDAPMIRMAVGRPMLARKLADRYVGSEGTRLFFDMVAKLGPLPREQRTRFAETLTKIWHKKVSPEARDEIAAHLAARNANSLLRLERALRTEVRLPGELLRRPENAKRLALLVRDLRVGDTKVFPVTRGQETVYLASIKRGPHGFKVVRPNPSRN